MNGTKLFSFLGCIGILSSLVLTVIFVIWLIFPYKVLDIKGDVTPVKGMVIAGETQYFHFNFCKYSNKQGVASVMLVNSSIIHFPSYSVSMDKGCYNKTIPLAVPDFAEAGEYKAVYSASYRVNPLREITIIFESLPFRVDDSR